MPSRSARGISGWRRDKHNYKENHDADEAGTLHDAFIDELRDTYDAEKQLTKALAKLAKAAISRLCATPSRPPRGNAGPD